MRFHTSALLAPLMVANAAAFTPASTTQTDLLAAKGLVNLAINQIEKAFTGTKSTCTLANAHVRREW
jgi:tyrosinase